MKKRLAAASLAALLVPALAMAQTPATQPAADEAVQAAPATQPSAEMFKTEMDKASYAIGTNIARGMKQQIPDVNQDLLIKGFRDAMADKAVLSEQEVMQTLMAFGQKMQQRQQEQQQKQAAESKAKSEAFLAENAEKEGVKVTASGLQYKVLEEGEGDSPEATDTVEVRYVGTLVDGTEFDSSRGQTVKFPVNGVIRGWSEALQMMKKGAKWKLFIPPDLAYGERQMGPKIPANSTLIFEVELVDIAEKPAAAPQPAEE